MTRLLKAFGLSRLFFLGAATAAVALSIFVYVALSPLEVVLNHHEGEENIISTRAKDVEGLLAEQGIHLEPGEQVLPSPRHPLKEGMEIEVRQLIYVEVKNDGESFPVRTHASSVQELLEELGFPAENAFGVCPPLNADLQPGDRVELSPYRVVEKKEEVAVPYDIEEREDEELPEGRIRILQEGEQGVQLKRFQVVYDGEEEIYRQLEEETLLKEPVQAVVAVGTKEIPGVSGQVASRSGGRAVTVTEGYASWYGPNFHGRRTASGEVYNQHDYTAAHRSLSFGTMVKVTFLKTDRSVMVRINDRGPYVGNRIIDLSRQAAEEIGLRAHGIGRVRLEIY